MKWSIRLGRFLGIDVFIHFSFLLLLIYVWVASKEDKLSMVLLVVCAFACVVLHEFGHALMARRYGIPTRDITLFIIGGVARLDRIPDVPRQELLIALAGPAVNVLLAGVLAVVCAAAGIDLPLWPREEELKQLLDGRAALAVRLFYWNITMVMFNMLPAFPMDGGRVVRALLAMFLPYERATSIAAVVGKTMAVVFICVALLVGHVTLILIAFFVWVGASDEAAAALQRSLLTGVKVRDAMLSDFRRVSPDDTVGAVAQLILVGWQADFPVVFNDEVVGLLTRQDVISGLASGQETTVSAIMRRDPASCHPEEALEKVLELMKQKDIPLLPVTENGQLRGLVTPENTIEFILLRRALANRLA